MLKPADVPTRDIRAKTIASDFAGESTTYVLRIAVKARQRALGPLHPGFDINRIIHESLVKLLPENAHILCSGKLHISLTRVCDGKNVLLSQFDSRDTLIQVVQSLHIFFFGCLLSIAVQLSNPKKRAISF